MENTTQLLLRQSDALAGRNVLVVDANAPALKTLAVDATVHVHADDYTIGAQQWSPAPTVPEGTDLLVLPLPKSIDRLRFLLNWLAGEITAPTELWLIGPAKGGIRGALKYLDAHVDESVLEDSARHCKLYSGLLQPGEKQSLKAWGTVLERWRIRKPSGTRGCSAMAVWTRAVRSCWRPWRRTRWVSQGR